MKTRAHIQETVRSGCEFKTPPPKKPSSYRTESTLTGKDVGVSVLLLVVVLVGLLIRPDGATPWQELQNKNTVRFYYTVLKDSQPGWLLAAQVNCVLLHVRLCKALPLLPAVNGPQLKAENFNFLCLCCLNKIILLCVTWTMSHTLYFDSDPESYSQIGSRVFFMNACVCAQ